MHGITSFNLRKKKNIIQYIFSPFPSLDSRKLSQIKETIWTSNTSMPDVYIKYTL